jgi:O-antigen/teichoic acid export membrane protein
MDRKEISIEKEVKTVFKPAVAYAGGYIFQNFFYLLSTILLAKIFDMNTFGLYSLAFAVVGLATILSGLGFNVVPSKFIPLYLQKNEKPKLRDFLNFLFLTQLLAAVSIAVVLLILAKPISTGIYNKPGLALFLVLLGVLLPFQKMAELLGSIFRGFKKVQYSVYIERIFEPAYRFLGLWVVFAMGFFIKGVFFVIYSGFILSLILSAIIYRSRIKTAFLADVREKGSCEKRDIVLYSLPLLGISVINYLMGKTDILIIGYFLSPDKVGIYNIAFKLSLLVYLSLLALNSIFAPLISELHEKNEWGKLANAYKSFTRTILYFSVFAFLGIFLLSEPLLSLIGKDFTAGVLPLVILSLGQLVLVSVGPAGCLLSMTKHPRLSLYNSLALLLLNIVLDLLLIPRYGIIGAAVATSTSMGLISIAKVIEVKCLLKLHPYSLSYLKPLVIGGISIGIVTVLGIRMGTLPPYILFPAFVALFILLTGLMGISAEERYMLSLLKNYDWRFWKKKGY